jgi:dienelactone hydrolase
MIAKDIAYECSAKTLTGYLATKGGARPGVLVCHQGMGVTEHSREQARRLAEAGYTAFALDMYGKTATTREQAMALLESMTGNPDELRRRALAGLEVLKVQDGVDRSRLAAVGYCFGGAVVLELARASSELKCVVALHPGMSGPVALPDSDPRPVHAKVMVCAGADDPLIPDSAKVKFAALMNAAGADWQLLVYGGAAHSFTDPAVDPMNLPGFKYHAAADRRSFAAMQDLFGETFGR